MASSVCFCKRKTETANFGFVTANGNGKWEFVLLGLQIINGNTIAASANILLCFFLTILCLSDKLNLWVTNNCICFVGSKPLCWQTNEPQSIRSLHSWSRNFSSSFIKLKCPWQGSAQIKPANVWLFQVLIEKKRTKKGCEFNHKVDQQFVNPVV